MGSLLALTAMLLWPGINPVLATQELMKADQWRLIDLYARARFSSLHSERHMGINIPASLSY